jgi:hypothetical protein
MQKTDMIHIEEHLPDKQETAETAQYLKRTIDVSNMAPVDLYKPEEVKQRIRDYFQMHIERDMKPTVIGLGLSLGIDRRRLWEIRTGALLGGLTDKQYPRETVNLIRQAHDILANLHEDYMLNGKIHPTIAVFMGVNYFDMKDVKQTEHVYIGSQTEDTQAKVDSIRAKYAKPVETEASVE